MENVLEANAKKVYKLMYLSFRSCFIGIFFEKMLWICKKEMHPCICIYIIGLRQIGHIHTELYSF